MDGAPAGWCQCGPRDRLTKLVDQFDLSPDPQVWAITCFLLAPEYHGQGLALYLLKAVLQDLKRLEVLRVQGYPRRGIDLSAGAVWTGPESLFQQAGFTIERDDPNRPIYGITLMGKKGSVIQKNPGLDLTWMRWRLPATTYPFFQVKPPRLGNGQRGTRGYTFNT